MSNFDGVGTLLRLALRRDRVWLPVWTTCLLAVNWLEVESLVSVYGTREGVLGYATTSASGMVYRLFGAIDGATLGSVMMVELWVFHAIFVGLMQLLLVVRHTRQDEAAGRLELVRSAVVGRHAGLAVAMLVSLLSCIVLAAGFAAGLILAGELPIGGAIAVALAWGGVGVVFGAVAAVTAQLAPSPRMARGLAGGMLGIAFVVRMIGDVAGDLSRDGLAIIIAWPSWLSPLGWGQLAYPFSELRWWALAPYPLAAGLLYAAAFALSARRDVGRGMLREPRGRARATRWLASPLALALRLDRGLVAGWAIGFVAFGAICGMVVDEVDSMLGANEQARELIAALGGSDVLVDAYLAILITYFGIAAAACAIQVVARVHAEEQGPGEYVLATATSRVRWLASHVVVAAGASTLILTLGGAAMLTSAVLVGVDDAARTVIVGTLVQVPALLVFIAIVVLGFGISSRWGTRLGWSLFFVAVFILFGQLVDLPGWIVQVSPFSHVPLVPVEDVTARPLVGLTAVALAMSIAGTACFVRRDIDTGA